MYDWLKNRGHNGVTQNGIQIPIPMASNCPNHEDHERRIGKVESCTTAIKQKQGVHETLIGEHYRQINDKLDTGELRMKEMGTAIQQISESVVVLVDRSNDRRSNDFPASLGPRR